MSRQPTHAELAFLLYGTPRPVGLWATRAGQTLCCALGHRPPTNGFGALRDLQEDGVLFTYVWACPRCGVRFVRAVYVRRGQEHNRETENALREAVRNLYLDVLYETNRGRRIALRWPVRSLASLENGPPPAAVELSNHGILSVSPPAK